MRLAIALLAFAVSVQRVLAAPISFNTALPVHEDGLLFRGQAIWMRMHNDPSSMNREMDVVAVPSVLVYGATSKLALMGVFPYVDKELEINSLGVKRQASGLGDIVTLGRYEIFEHNGPGQTLRGAIFGGLKWPSGKHDETDALGPLPPVVQPGSGSYDPIVGTVWTRQWLPFEVDADLFYQHNNRADGFRFGDVFQEDASFQYRLWPRHLTAEGVPGYIYGVLEANSIYQAKNEVAGVQDNDSGGYQLFLVPGLQWVTKRTVFEVAAQLPAVQDLNGTALKADFNLIASARVWF